MTATTPVVHISQPFDVLVDRRTIWGNFYVIGRDGSRADVCRLHKTKLWSDLLTGRISLKQMAALSGKTLGCHCAPLQCHGDNLAEAADLAAVLLARGMTAQDGLCERCNVPLKPGNGARLADKAVWCPKCWGGL